MYAPLLENKYLAGQLFQLVERNRIGEASAILSGFIARAPALSHPLSAHSLRIAFGNSIARLTPCDVSTSTISY